LNQYEPSYGSRRLKLFLKKQLEYYKKLLEYKLACLTKYFHPYADFHLKKAYD
jgi:hypothetical protein